MSIENHVYKGSIFKGMDKVVSNNELRPVMGQAVIIDGKIVATDAHHLVEIDLKFFGLKDECIKHLQDKGFPRELLQKLGALKSNQQWFINEQGINVLKNNSHKVGLIYPLSEHKEEGKYPNYKAVIPEDVVELSQFTVAPLYLMNIEKVFRSVVGEPMKPNNLKTILHGTNKALTLKNEEGTFLGLVMPKQNSF